MGAQSEKEEKGWGRKLAGAKADSDRADWTTERKKVREMREDQRQGWQENRTAAGRAHGPTQSQPGLNRTPEGRGPERPHPGRGQAHFVGGTGQEPPLGMAQIGSSPGRGLTSAGPQECSRHALQA